MHLLKAGGSILAKIEAGLEHSKFEFRISDFGFAQPSMSAKAFGSDWAQLACSAVPYARRRKAGRFRFRDPLNPAFGQRLLREKQERRFTALRLDEGSIKGA